MLASGAGRPTFNTSAAREQLSRLFLRFKQVQDGKIELAWAETSDWKLRHAEHFPVSPEGIDALIARAVQVNLNANVYIGAALRNPDVPPFGRSEDEDFYAAVAVWVDLDDDDAVQTAIARLPQFGIRPNMVVTTGTIPAPRVQLWFLLDEPSPDAVAIRKLNEALVAALPGSDASVVNVSRVMRLAGSISYPPPKKQAKGYVVELTTLAIPVETPYPLDRIERVFAPKDMLSGPAAAPARVAEPGTTAPPAAASDEKPATILGLTRVSDLVRQIKAGPLWHEPMIRLVAHLVSTGRSNLEILAWAAELTMPGFTVDQTRQEMRQAIDGARRKWSHADVDETVGAAEPPKPRQFMPAADFMAQYVPPVYLIDGVVQRGFLYSWTAKTGHGKTAVALYMAACVANGLPFGPFQTEKGRVGILAGENPDDVRVRLIMLEKFYNIDLSGVFVLPGAFDLTAGVDAVIADIERVGGLDLVIVDTAAAYARMDDENSNAAMGLYAQVMRKLIGAKGAPAVVVPCHPAKAASEEGLAPRGGGAFLAEVDGNLICWKHHGMTRFHWQQKFRGPEFMPVEFDLVEYRNEAVKDSKGRPFPSVVAKHLTEAEILARTKASVRDEDLVMASIQRYPGQSLADRAMDLNWTRGVGTPNKQKVGRVIEGLEDAKMIERVRGGGWKLTEKGRTELEKASDIPSAHNDPNAPENETVRPRGRNADADSQNHA